VDAIRSVTDVLENGGEYGVASRGIGRR